MNSILKMEQLNDLDELKDILGKYNIAPEEVCIVGSYVLNNYKIRKNGDIDFCTLNRNKELFKNDLVGNYLNERVNVVNDKYEKLIGISDNELVNNKAYHYFVDGLKVIRLEVEFAAKICRNWPKDKIDIPNIENKIYEIKGFDWDLVRGLIISNQQIAEEKRRRQKEHQKKVVKKTTQRIKKPSTLSRLKYFGTNLQKHPRSTAKRVAKKVLVKLNLYSPPPPPRKKSEVKKVSKKKTPTPTTNILAQITHWMPVSALLHSQIYDGKYHRYDILLRYLLLQAIKNNEEENIRKYQVFYEKMQNKRIGEENAKRYSLNGLNNLLNSILKEGFNKRFPIPITEDGVLTDGAHRVACALLTDMEEIPVLFLPKKQKIDFGRQWFEKNEFPNDLLSEMDHLLEKLLREKGIYFLAIVWPPAYPLAEDIQKEVAEEYRIIQSYDIALEEQDFADFAREIYAIDDIDSWKVEVKISAMKHYPTNIRVLIFEMQEPDFRVKMRTHAYLSGKGAELKKKIRNKYKDKISDYFYDIIFHTGDNHEHNIEMMKAVIKYNKVISK